MTSDAAAGAAPEWPAEPVVYEVNTVVWLGEVAGRVGQPVTLGSVPPAEWDAAVPPGVSVVWLMGVWSRSPAGREVALANPDLRASWSAALPDWSEADVVGSAYCIRDYEPDERLGGWAALDAARAQLAARGARLMLDWVPNHVGPDSPWLLSHPDAFVHGTAEDLARDPAGFADIAGRVFAKGKDPYFPPWPDVIQVDAYSPDLRRLAAETLTRIAGHADAVRCDMAMLMLDDVVTATWGDRVGDPLPTTYWTDVIAAVRGAHPDFRFVAEAYWDREWDLQQLGFDYCYDKRLYDRLAQGEVSQARGHLDADLAYQRRLLRFLENHDEPRAATVFAPRAREQVAAVAVATLPGLTLWHDGQAEGRAVFTPVFLGRRVQEPTDADLAWWYRRLWVAGLAVRRGAWSRCEVTGWPDNTSSDAMLAWSWSTDDEVTVVVVNLGPTQADGVVHVGHPAPADGAGWTLTDLLEGTTYERSAHDLGDGGMYVSRPGWGAHVLHASPQAPAPDPDNQEEPDDVDG